MWRRLAFLWRAHRCEPHSSLRSSHSARSVRHFHKRKAPKINRAVWSELAYERKRSLKEQEEEDDDDNFFQYLEKEVSRTYLDKWKTSMEKLIENSKSSELLTTDSKDIKCFHALRYLAKEKGLHCQLYWKTIVISKFPLPFYRPDLDPNRPQRQVFLASNVFHKVNAHLEEYEKQKKRSVETEGLSQAKPATQGDLPTNAQDVYAPVTRIIGDARRSVWMFEKQRAWQDSREGRIVLGFRNKLPAFKYRGEFLEAVGRSQFLGRL